MVRTPNVLRLGCDSLQIGAFGRRTDSVTHRAATVWTPHGCSLRFRVGESRGGADGRCTRNSKSDYEFQAREARASTLRRTGPCKSPGPNVTVVRSEMIG